MNTVMMRNLEIGVGAPKVIVPVVASTIEAIAAKGKELTAYSMDIVEWRVDFFQDVFRTEQVLEAARQLRAALGETPILFTFRTKKEGGEKAIEMEEYIALNKALLESGYIDAVDVEIFSGDDVVREIIDAAHADGKVVVGSNHDFFATPSVDDIIYRLRKMQDMGCDLPKIAVMPQNRMDVASLLLATAVMKEKYAVQPVTTMSMSSKGVITRIAGEAFGSAMTFGAVGQVSAPGQIPVEKLQTAMGILHDGM